MKCSTLRSFSLIGWLSRRKVGWATSYSKLPTCMIRTNYPLKKFLQKNAKQNKLAFFVSEAQNKFVDKT
jgi:type III secretory pathway component EscR